MNKIKNIKAMACILLFVLLALKGYAMPVPHGIDGHVYDLDSITPADNIYFSINDTTTGEFIQGKTRDDGRYSVALNGNNGNIIVIKVWNKYNTNNKTVTLEGVMHNVVLLLNMTIPELPPDIISEPITTAYVSEWYFYQVNATDANNDELQYNLLENPKNMHINETGFIKWKPNKNHIGNNTIIVEVSDNILNTIQIFNITVYTNQKYSPQSNGRSGGGGGHVSNLFPKENTEDTKEKQEETGKEGINKGILIERIIEKPSNIIEKIILKSKQDIKLNVKDLPKKPDKIKSLDKKVYTYLEIKAEESIKQAENTKIQFKVKEKWLEENHAGTADIILNRHVDNKWERLETTYLNSKDGYAYYEAKTPGFSYFAISLNETKEPDNIIITGPKEQYIISGVIYKNNRKTQVKKTDLRITNTNTGEVIETKTSIGNNPGAYYVIIKGNYGDKIEIEVKGFDYTKTSIVLTGDMKDVNLVLNNNGLSDITGYAFADIKLNKKQSTVILIAMAMLITISGYIKIKRI